MTGATDPVTEHIVDADEQSILHMTTTDPLRTPTFTDFAQPDVLLPDGYLSERAHVAGLSGRQSGVRVEPRRRPAGGQRRPGSEWSGPTVQKLGQTNAIWTDHTDIRPTMLSMLGLSSDYDMDGAAVAQLMSRGRCRRPSSDIWVATRPRWRVQAARRGRRPVRPRQRDRFHHRCRERLPRRRRREGLRRPAHRVPEQARCARRRDQVRTQLSGLRRRPDQ